MIFSEFGDLKITELVKILGTKLAWCFFLFFEETTTKRSETAATQICIMGGIYVFSFRLFEYKLNPYRETNAGSLLALVAAQLLRKRFGEREGRIGVLAGQ